MVFDLLKGSLTLSSLFPHLLHLCEAPGIPGQTQTAVSFLVCFPCSVPAYCEITRSNSITCTGIKAVEKILDK